SMRSNWMPSRRISTPLWWKPWGNGSTRSMPPPMATLTAKLIVGRTENARFFSFSTSGNRSIALHVNASPALLLRSRASRPGWQALANCKSSRSAVTMRAARWGVSTSSWIWWSRGSNAYSKHFSRETTACSAKGRCGARQLPLEYKIGAPRAAIPVLRLVALRIQSLGVARFRHQKPHRGEADKCDRGQSGESKRTAEMIADVAGERGAHRGADADEGADDSLPEVEVTAAAGQVGDDQRHHDAEDGGSHAVEQLHDDQQLGIGHRRKKQAANRQCGETDQQQ